MQLLISGMWKKESASVYETSVKIISFSPFAVARVSGALLQRCRNHVVSDGSCGV
jgi:hypothetical protein